VSPASTRSTSAGSGEAFPGTAASGAIASTSPRFALDRVTRREDSTANRTVSPSGREAAASSTGPIATAAATSSA
jgi:hypothetical protein